MIFYKKVLCYNTVVLYTMCKLAANELQRLSSLYCVNLCTERTGYRDVQLNAWSCFTRAVKVGLLLRFSSLICLLFLLLMFFYCMF